MSEHKSGVCDYDLANNPMIESAKKALSPEQIEDYKKIGEYMYNNFDYKIKEVGSQVKPPTETNLAIYAREGLKAGLLPTDLSMEEINALYEVCGNNWYEEFGFKEEEVPKPFAHAVTERDLERERQRNQERNQERNLVENDPSRRSLEEKELNTRKAKKEKARARNSHNSRNLRGNRTRKHKGK